MSEQVLNQFRSDKTLREECVAIYEAMGMDLNTAFPGTQFYCYSGRDDENNKHKIDLWENKNER